MNKTLNFIKSHKYVFSFISGIIFATPSMQEWLFPLTFLGLILFFYLSTETIETVKKKKIFSRSFKRFSLFFLGQFLTIYTLFFKLYPLEGYDFTTIQGISIVIFAWLASSLIHGTLGGVILCLSDNFKTSPFVHAISCGALWVIFEFSLSLGFLAFPWVNVSLSLVKLLPFIQTASLFGNGIITFITVFSCCCIASFLNNRKNKTLIKAAALVLSFNFLLGSIIFIIPEEKGKEVSVCIIQGNVAMGEKWQAGVLYDILSQHDKLIRTSLEKQKCDVVLMAETVFPAVYTENGLIYKTISKTAKEYNVTVIFGVILKSENEGKYNAMIAIYPDGTTSTPYVKQKLVPFGEKVPSLDIIGALVPAIKELNLDSSYIEGTECQPLPSHDNTIYGPLVCYDSVFSSLARENVLKGAEILAVSTNDSWYKDGLAVKQHQNQSVIRAIETGRYVFRSANTGISCIISSKGIIKEESGILTEECILGKGYASNRKTLYVILGNSSLYLSFLTIFFLFTIKLVKKWKKQQKF